MQILHITAHMGGGAGNAISNVITEDSFNTHCLICLQSSEKRQYIEKCLENKIQVLEEPEYHTILMYIEQSDLIILHWWNHPLMCGFLAKFPIERPVRMILWAHISGCAYPILQEQFALQFNQIFVTTPFSFENKEWSVGGRKKILEKSTVVYGIGNLDVSAFRVKQHKQKAEFVVGYVGTLAKAKLHPQYLDYCQEILKYIPHCKFLMVGDIEAADWLLNEIRARKLEEHFRFTGYCTDVPAELDKMDVFAYPLNPHHFGTTENAILEAMLAGLPVVMLNQNTEKYIVTSGENGILVSSKEEYAEEIFKLYSSADLRERLGTNARNHVIRKYDSNKNVMAFEEGIQRAMAQPKQQLRLKQFIGSEPYKWLLYGMDRESRAYFEKSLSGENAEIEKLKEYILSGAEILCGQSKSSITQFVSFYPEDKYLRFWNSFIRNTD